MTLTERLEELRKAGIETKHHIVKETMLHAGQVPEGFYLISNQYMNDLMQAIREVIE